MNCFVCDSIIIGASNEHHVVMQAHGGTEGPTVMLCPTCHTLLHNVAKKMIAGKDASHLYAHFTDLAKNRLNGLVQVILIGELQEKENPHPMIMIALDSPLYLQALKLYQKDNGFSSQEKAVNSIFRAIAIKYNLLSNNSVKTTRGRVKLSRVESST